MLKSCGSLQSNMLLDFSYSDIPWDTFLLTAIRTSGCKFWMNCHSVSCSMPVFVTHLHYNTFSLLITGNSYDNISRVGFINDFDLEATFAKIIYYFRYWSRLLLFSYSDIWNLSYPNFKVPKKTLLCLFLSQVITLKPIWGSGFLSLVYPANAINSCTNEYSDPRFWILVSFYFLNSNFLTDVFWN